MVVGRVADDIVVGSTWRATIGEHEGVVVEVLSFNGVSVTCRPQGGNGKHWDRGKSHRNKSQFWRLPVDAFLNRYECIGRPKPKPIVKETMPDIDELRERHDEKVAGVVRPELTPQEREIIDLYVSEAATIGELSKTYGRPIRSLVALLRVHVPNYEELASMAKLKYDRERSKRKYHERKGDIKVTIGIDPAADGEDRTVYGSVSVLAATNTGEDSKALRFEVTGTVMRPFSFTEVVTAARIEDALAVVRSMAGDVEVTGVRLLK